MAIMPVLKKMLRYCCFKFLFIKLVYLPYNIIERYKHAQQGKYYAVNIFRVRVLTVEPVAQPGEQEYNNTHLHGYVNKRYPLIALPALFVFIRRVVAHLRVLVPVAAFVLRCLSYCR